MAYIAPNNFIRHLNEGDEKLERIEANNQKTGRRVLEVSTGIKTEM